MLRRGQWGAAVTLMACALTTSTLPTAALTGLKILASTCRCRVRTNCRCTIFAAGDRRLSSSYARQTRRTDRLTDWQTGACEQNRQIKSNILDMLSRGASLLNGTRSPSLGYLCGCPQTRRRAHLAEFECSTQGLVVRRPALAQLSTLRCGMSGELHGQHMLFMILLRHSLTGHCTRGNAQHWKDRAFCRY